MKIFLVPVIVLLVSFQTSASMVASDYASDPAYGDGWQAGDNGGTGWGGAWNISTTFGSDINTAGTLVQTSQDNGFGNGNIDTLGSSLGLYANSSHFIFATRAFDEDLSVGQSVILDMDNGFIDNGSRVGFTITGFGEIETTEQFSFYFVGGDDHYTISNGQLVFTVEQDTGVDFTTAGLRVMFTLTDEESYALAITPNGGSTTTINGDFLIPAEFDHIELYNSNAGSGSANDVFFNSIQVVPEPATAGLMLLGLIALLKRGHRL